MSACGSLPENVSTFLDGISRPHMESLPSYIKDNTDIIPPKGQLPPLLEDSFLVSWIVGSLYSNILHNEGFEACQYFMRNGIRESPPQSENLIMARVYVRSITRRTMYQKSFILLAGTGVWKIISVARGFSSIKSIILII